MVVKWALNHLLSFVDEKFPVYLAEKDFHEDILKVGEIDGHCGGGDCFQWPPLATACFCSPSASQPDKMIARNNL
jgi:hypothetical protein